MRRKASWAAAGMIPTLIAANYMPRFILYTFCSLLALALAVVGWFRHQGKLIKTSFLLAAAVIAAGAFLIHYEVYNRPISLYESQKINAELVFVENNGGYWSAKINHASCKGKPVRLLGKTHVSAYEYDVKPYDIADVEFTLLCAEDGSNDSFIADSVKIQNIRHPKQKTLAQHLDEFREDVITLLQVRIGGEEGVLAASILTGESEDLPADTQLLFSRTGLTHITAVSGLHLTILSVMLSLFMSQVNANWKIVTIVSVLLVGLVVVLAGFSMSVLRAAIMSIVLLLGRFGDREADPLNSLGLALILIGLTFPFEVVKPSFLLSAAATLGILVLSPMLEQFILGRTVLSRLQRRQTSLICVSISSAIFTAPILIFYFGEISVLSVPAMSIVNYPVMLILVGSALFCCLYWIPFVGDFIGFLVRIAAKLVLELVEILASFDQATIPARSIPMILLFVVGCLVLLLWFALRKKIQLRRIMVGTLAGIMIAVSCITPWYSRLFTRHTALNAGSSISNVYINYGKVIVVDCSDRYLASDVKEQVHKHGINKIDLLVVTNLDEDICGGVPTLLSYISARQVILPRSNLHQETYRKIIEAAQKNSADIILIDEDYAFSLDKIQLNLYAINMEQSGYFVKITDEKTTIGACASLNDKVITQCLCYPIGEFYVDTLVIGIKAQKGSVNSKLMYLTRPDCVCVSSSRRDLTRNEKNDIEAANVQLIELNWTQQQMMYDYRKGKLWIYQN